jgi:hypothetical protein
MVPVVAAGAGAGLGGALGAALPGIGYGLSLGLGGLFNNTNWPQVFNSYGWRNPVVQPGTTASPGASQGAPGVDPAMPIPDWLKSSGLGGTIMDVLQRALGGGSSNSNSSGGGSILNEELLKFLGLTGVNLFGAVQQQNQQDWTKNSVVDLMNYYRGVGGSAQNQIGSIQNAFLPQMLGQMGTFQNLANSQQSDLASRLGNAQSFLGQAFMTPTAESRVPGIRDVMNFTGGIAGAGTDILRMLGQNLGQNSQMSGGMDIARLMAGGQTGDFNTLRGLGGQLTQGGGSTPFTQAVQGAGINALGNQGMTPQLQGIQQQAQGLFGLDPSTAMASGRSMDILGRDPLLPMDQVVSMARNQAATGAQNRLRTLKRELMNRTGVGGPMIGSGQTNELLTELGDEALQAESAAVQNAIMQQQGLQLQQFGMGGDLYSRAQQGFQGRQGLGLDALLNVAKTASGRETGVPGLSLGGGQLDLARMLGGAGLFGDTMQGQLGGLNAMGNLFGQQQQGYGQAASLLNALNGLGQTQQQNVFGLQDFGLRSADQMYGALGNLLGIQSGLGDQAMKGMLGTAGLGQNSQSQWMQLFSDMARSQAGLFGNPAQSSPFAQFAQTMTQGLNGGGR